MIDRRQHAVFRHHHRRHHDHAALREPAPHREALLARASLHRRIEPVFDVILPGLEHEGGSEVPDVSGETQLVRVRRFVQREIGRFVLDRANLEEVDFLLRKLADDAPRVVRRGDGNAQPLERLDALGGRVLAHPLDVARRLEIWPRDEHAWADARAGANFTPPAQQLLVIAAHVANGRHAVRHEQAERRGARLRGMRVHLDEAGHEELAGAVDDPRLLWDRHARRGTERADAIAGDDDGRAGDGCGASRGNHGHVADRDRGWRRTALRTNGDQE